MEIRPTKEFSIFPTKKTRFTEFPLVDHNGEPLKDDLGVELKGVHTEVYWHVFYWELH